MQNAEGRRIRKTKSRIRPSGYLDFCFILLQLVHCLGECVLSCTTECYVKLFSISSCPLHTGFLCPSPEIHVHWNYNSYSVCPRCKATMEREYQSFCDRCGQRLDWSKYENAEVVYTGWNGPAANEDDKQECGNQFAEHSDKSVYSS